MPLCVDYVCVHAHLLHVCVHAHLLHVCVHVHSIILILIKGLV